MGAVPCFGTVKYLLWVDLKKNTVGRVPLLKHSISIHIAPFLVIIVLIFLNIQFYYIPRYNVYFYIEFE